MRTGVVEHSNVGARLVVDEHAAHSVEVIRPSSRAVSLTWARRHACVTSAARRDSRWPSPPD